jgi:hypothetical protein
MAIADIKNSILRRSIIALLTPVALIVYAAFGAAMYVCDYLVTDVKDAWHGSAVTHRMSRRREGE